MVNLLGVMVTFKRWATEHAKKINNIFLLIEQWGQLEELDTYKLKNMCKQGSY